MECPQCGADDHTHIEIELKDEQRLEFFGCRRCEKKWWKDTGGGTINLNEVLSLAAVGARR